MSSDLRLLVGTSV